MPDIPAIDGLADASDARVLLFQSGRQVHAPVRSIGLQPLDATLTALAALSGAAGKGVYFTGADIAALFDLTAAGRALLDDADAVAQRATLGIARELISATALSNVASWSQTGLSAFRRLHLSGWAAPATDGVSGIIRTDANGGASFDAGASDYTYQRTRSQGGTVAGEAAGTTGVFLNAATGNAGAESIWFAVDLFEFNKARNCTFVWSSGTLDASTGEHMVSGAAYRLDSTARDAIQFVFASGNIAAGHIVLEGIRG